MRHVGLLIAALTLPITVIAESHEKPAGITSTLMELEVMHNGEFVIIKRNQNGDNTIASDYALTFRPCPPFCIQPMDFASGVETVAELELLTMVGKMNFVELDGLLIDSRNPDWTKRHNPGSNQSPLDHSLCEKIGHVHHIGYFRNNFRSHSTRWDVRLFQFENSDSVL